MLNPDKIDHRVEQIIVGHTASRVHRLLQSKLGLWVIAAISFFESSLPVPLITDPFMVAGILANRSRVWLVVGIAIISSIVGGLAAFAMAAFFFDVIAAYLMTPELQSQFHSRLSFAASDTFVTTVTGAITPFPYTITAWVVAVAGGSVWVFLMASIVGRTVRYAIVGYCTYAFGPSALGYARRSLLVTTVIVFILVGVYVWLKL